MSGSITAGDVRTGNFLDALAHPTVVNPLAAYSGAAEAANRVWGIRKWQAEQAAGEAQQAGVDASGIYQPNTAAAALKAAGPGAALAAGQTLESSQRLGTAQTDQGAKISALFATTVAPLINLPDDQIHQGVLDAAQRLIAAGAPAAQVHAGLLNMSTDPATLRQQLEMIRQSHLPPDQQQQNIYTRPTQLDTGPVIQGAGTDVRTGAITPAGPGIGKALTPEAGAAIVTIGTDANGKEIRGTAQQAKNLAEGRALNDNGPGVLGTGRPQPGSPLLNPNKPSATPPATPGVQATPGGGFAVGQPPAARSAQEATGTASAGKFQAIVQQGTQARSQDALLATMLSEAQGFRPGPGADLAATFKRTILGLGAQVGTNFGIDEKKLAAQESVIKIGNQLADAQGAGSDARLRVNEGANPSIHNTPAGLDLIIRQLRGNADYLRVRQQVAAAYPDKADIEGFESKIGANLDPRVFQYERLKPDQKADYFNGLTDKNAFIKAHDWAAAQKLLGAGG